MPRWERSRVTTGGQTPQQRNCLRPRRGQKGTKNVGCSALMLASTPSHANGEPRKPAETRAMSQSGKNGLTYSDAGVDIDAGNLMVEKIKPAVRSTRRPGADGEIGGFGGLFDLKAAASPTLFWLLQMMASAPSSKLRSTRISTTPSASISSRCASTTSWFRVQSRSSSSTTLPRKARPRPGRCHRQWHCRRLPGIRLCADRRRDG